MKQQELSLEDLAKIVGGNMAMANWRGGPILTTMRPGGLPHTHWNLGTQSPAR